jgi:hypothetical protein
MKYYLIIIIIIIIYICCYFIFPPDIYIIQSNISDFNFSSLLSRQPIVLDDYLKEPEKLIDLWFNFNFKTPIHQENDNWCHNKNKFLFINATEDTEIIIYKATYIQYIPNENDKIIIIKLKKSQSFIIPYRWNYYLNSSNVMMWGINDLITSFLIF